MEIPTDDVIGGRIREARKAAGIEQQGDLVPQLRAAGLPWSQGTLSRVEAGLRALKLTEAAVVADVLGVPLAALLGPVEDDAASQAAVKMETFVAAVRLGNIRRTVLKEYRDALRKVREATDADPAFRDDIQSLRDRYLATEQRRARKDAERDGEDVSTPELLRAYMWRWGHLDVPMIRTATDVLGDGDDVLGTPPDGQD